MYSLAACTPPHAKHRGDTCSVFRGGPTDDCRNSETHALVWAKVHGRAQIAFLSAATAKALTTVLAGLALTITTLPKISFLPALVAGLRRVLIMQRPGIVHFPTFFTSCVATLARVSKTFVTSDSFSSVPSARACARAPLVMGFPPFIAFIAFIGAMALGGAEMRS